MSVHHDREKALLEIRTMPEQNFVDGVFLDVPKRRRRQQAMGTAAVRIQWPKEQKKRFATQYNRYVELLSKDLGIEILLRRLEAPSDAQLQQMAQGGESEIEKEALDLLRAAKDLFEDDADCQTVESDAWVWLKQTEMFLKERDPEIEIEAEPEIDTGCLGDA